MLPRSVGAVFRLCLIALDAVISRLSADSASLRYAVRAISADDRAIEDIHRRPRDLRHFPD